MLTALWRGLWKADRAPSTRGCFRGSRPLSFRPSLESLEGREVPALLGGGYGAAAVSGLFSLPHPPACQPPGSSSLLHVTVAENAPATVMDLGSVFSTVPGLQHEDGLQFSVLGNTNAALVRTELSDAALILTYLRGRSGTSTLTVCATDADGVSVQQRILVTVRPLHAIHVGPTPVPIHVSTPPMTWW